jgi:hypothetical protein
LPVLVEERVWVLHQKPYGFRRDALVAELRAQLAEMRSQRDAWQGIAERLALGAPKPELPGPKVSWWRLRTPA